MSEGARLTIPELSLVLLIGPSGCGKSTFARTKFGRFETISSDFCRGLVSNDETDQSASKAAFETLHLIVGKRLERGLFTVVDATNVQIEGRRPLLELAKQYHTPAIAIVFDFGTLVCEDRDRARTERHVGAAVIRRQSTQLHDSFRTLRHEGFHEIRVLRTPEDADALSIERQPLESNRRSDRGPFDIIGDVHGCGDELDALLSLLGYRRHANGVFAHPGGRRAIFIGDLVDRGPRVSYVLRTVMDMVGAGHAFAVPGNHDNKLLRKLRGHRVQIRHGLAATLEQLERETPDFRARVASFLAHLPSHYVLDGGSLVVAHAGMKESLQGRESGAVRAFALFGETTGETDELGLPVRYNWAADYRGAAHVVYGHTPVPRAEWLNRTIDIDTGCVFGGSLTALRWPERELVAVPASRTYTEPARPFLT